MFVPIIMGSDKTMVSVATGYNEYHPIYASIGNVHNCVHHAHRNTLALIGFLTVPKSKLLGSREMQEIYSPNTADKQYSGDAGFQKFRRQLYHSSLSTILQSLKPGMTVPEVTRCSDGHFRRAIYGLGPYIADYPEQALLACIVQGWCPR
jgi:hypothetical protein